MNVRFKMTDKGEVAILPRKDYEALAAKAQEADEDFGTAATRSRSEVACRKCEIDYGSGYRVYFVRRGEALVILVAGGDKRTQNHDVAMAIKLARDL